MIEKIKNLDLESTKLSPEDKKVMDVTAKHLVEATGTDLEPKVYLNTLAVEMKSNNPVVVNRATKAAKAFTQDLLLLVLKQKLVGMSNFGHMDIVSLFNDGALDVGNTKQYTHTIITGNGVYDESKFVPGKVSLPEAFSHTVSFFKNAAQELTPEAFQFKKSLTIFSAQWQQYFLSGKLGEFVENAIDGVTKSYKFFIFDKIATKISNVNPQKKVTGTATNLFEAVTGEVLPLIANMSYAGSEYNYAANTGVITETNPEDILIFASQNIRTKLSANVGSQLFNNKLADPEAIYSKTNVISLGKKVIMGAEDAKVTMSTVDYIDDTTIIVMSKNSIVYLTVADAMEEQNWSENMAKQVTLHQWGVVDVLPYGQVFKYTNPNLGKAPGIKKAV